MGHDNKFFGAIEEIPRRSLPEALWAHLFATNEAAIRTIEEDGLPPLSSAMFHVTPCEATYRSRIFSFAGTFNGITSPELDVSWLERFERLLSRMYWERATLIGYPDVCQHQMAVWHADLTDVWPRPETSGELRPVRRWRRVVAPVPEVLR